MASKAGAEDDIAYSREQLLHGDDSDDDLLDSARASKSKKKAGTTVASQPANKRPEVKATPAYQRAMMKDDEEDFAPFGKDIKDNISALQSMIDAGDFRTSVPVPSRVTEPSAKSLSLTSATYTGSQQMNGAQQPSTTLSSTSTSIKRQ